MNEIQEMNAKGSAGAASGAKTMGRRPSRTLRIVIGVATCAAAVGCAERPDTTVRPLVDIERYDTEIITVDHEDLKSRLEKLADEVADLTPGLRDWSEVTTDLMNPVIRDVTFINQNREAITYAGGGDAASSMASAAEWAIFGMTSGETGICWGIRMSGNLADPTVEYSNIFSPGCAARQLVEEAVWQDQWPEPAPPPEDGVITFGEPQIP